MEIPKEPVIFFKATTSLVGPNDDLVIPKGGQKVDSEVELAVVIGKKGTYVEREEALEYVAGYVLHNDYSERVFQLERGGQWVKGKSVDTFAPLGPFLATRDEIPDTSRLGMWLKGNGIARQHSSTREMIFDVATLVSYVSQFMTLLPGDVISTGNTGWSRTGHEASAISESGRSRGIGDRQAWRVAAKGCCLAACNSCGERPSRQMRVSGSVCDFCFKMSG
jgi:2-keto-4-pentenoate hydratase/2-oxohepta-3-ene-1,7-dioic acid hydratase in catechol pathway